jgi:hypothetical protein
VFYVVIYEGTFWDGMRPLEKVMSIVKIFGLRIGKEKSLSTKIRKVLPIDRAVQSLRSRIDSEYRENFPSLARFKELCADAAYVNGILDSMIEKKEHGDDAIRMRDELGKKIEALGAKIRSNLN